MAEPVEPPTGSDGARGSVETMEGGPAQTSAEPAGDRRAGADTSARSGAARLLGDARVAWAVALLAVLAAVVLGVQWQSLRAEAAAREEARETAEVIAARVTTFEGATIDEFVEQVQAMATGEYASQVTELFDQEFRDALREGEVKSVGEVSRSFVQDLDDDEAEVFLLIRQTSVNAALDEPIEDELRMELTLRQVDGQWLAADIAVLGPEPSLAPPAAAEEEGQG